MRKTFALDATTDVISMALAEPLQKPLVWHYPAGRVASAFLVPWIQEVLAQTHTPLSSLESVIIPQGPGSFTGIRLGLAAAQGLNLALNLRILGVNLMSFLADQAFIQKGMHSPCLVAVPFLRDQVITQLFSPLSASSSDHASPEIMDTHAFSCLRAQTPANVVWSRDIPSWADPQDTVISWDASHLLTFGRVKGTEDPTPLYVRPPSTTSKAS